MVSDLPGYMIANVDLLIVKKHSIDSFNSCLCGFSCLIMNIAIATGAALLVGSDLARQNVTKRSESVMESLLAVNTLTSKE
jgi:hypothetical protein